MAVTANQQIVRQGRDGKIRGLGVAGAKRLYGGTLAFVDVNGFATDERVDANTEFAGVVREEVDNSSGGDGDLDVELITDGDFEFDIAGLTQPDIGVAIHATDNFTPTKTATDNPRIGELTGFVSTSRGLVSIRGLGEAKS